MIWIIGGLGYLVVSVFMIAQGMKEASKDYNSWLNQVRREVYDMISERSE